MIHQPKLTHTAFFSFLLLALTYARPPPHHHHTTTIRDGRAVLSQRPSCTPEQVHIALTSNPSEMRVMWSTRSPGCGNTVHYCPSSDNHLDTTCFSSASPPARDHSKSMEQVAVQYIMSVHGTETRVDNQVMCSSPAREDSSYPIYVHSAILPRLAPHQRYHYRIPQRNHRIAAGNSGNFTDHDHEYYSGGDNGEERIFSFFSHAPPSPDATLTFVTYGDMGSSYAHKCPGAVPTATAIERHVALSHGDDVSSSDESLPAGILGMHDGMMQRMTRAPLARVDMVLHVGDIAYADGSQQVWDDFMDLIEPYASRVPYMISVGNHEVDWKRDGPWPTHDASGQKQPYSPDWLNADNDSGGECGYATVQRFTMPGTMLSSPSSFSTGPWSVQTLNIPHLNWPWWQRHRPNSPFWYSFQDGPVHFIVLSTEHSLESNSDQRLWLEKELQTAVNRCTTPWLLVAMHRPAYVPFPHKSNRKVAKHLKRLLESDFSRYGVDMVISGHVHSYLRTCSVLHGSCVGQEDGGIAHVIVGTGGKRLTASDSEYYQPDWLERVIAVHGYGVVEVDGGRTLKFEFIATDGEDKGKVVDSVVLDGPKMACRSHSSSD